MEKANWLPSKNRTESFYLQEEPEMMHVIKTGFKDRYMVVYEDAYDQHTGQVITGTKAEIEEMYSITLSIE